MPVSVSILSILCLIIMLLLIPHITRTNRKGLASFKKYYKKVLTKLKINGTINDVLDFEERTKVH